MALNIAIQNEQNYYYLQLAPQLQGIYQQCVDHLSRGELNITVDAQAIEDFDSALERIFTALDYGCPELFFIDKGTKYTSDGNSIKLTFSSKYALNKLQQMWKDISIEVDDIIDVLDEYQSEEDKLWRLNEFICTHIKTNSGSAGQYGDAHGALVNCEARCEGICKAVQLVLNRLNIKNVIAYGIANRDGNRENHAWNIAWIDNEPHGFDFTWNIDCSMFGVVAVDYMFLSKEDIDIEHISNSDFEYPITQFSRLAYWYQHNTEITYRSDFSNVLLKEVGNNYYAIMRMMLSPTYDEVKDEVYDWYISEMGGDTIYGNFYYRYNPGLGVLYIYIIVEEF